MNIKDFYNKYPYPNVNETYPHGIQNYSSVMAPKGFHGNILVVGCGTAEAVIIAYKNPKSKVFGIDLSSTSIDIARDLSKNLNLTNLFLQVADVTEFSTDQKFDYVVSSCVLHHIENVKSAISNIFESMHENAVFGGVVYSKNRPSKIREIKNLNFQTMEDLRNYLKNNPDDWYNNHQKNDIELADIYLNPYWIEYDESSVLQLLYKFKNHKIISHEDKIFFKCEK